MFKPVDVRDPNFDKLIAEQIVEGGKAADRAAQMQSFIFWTVVTLFVVWFLWKLIQKGSNKERRYKELLASGFCESYVLRGSVIFAFDTINREFAVVYSNSTYRCSFDKIDSWNYEWETLNGQRRNDRFIITVLDPDRPRHVTYASTSVCTHWHAKMTALMAD